MQANGYVFDDMGPSVRHAGKVNLPFQQNNKMLWGRTVTGPAKWTAAFSESIGTQVGAGVPGNFYSKCGQFCTKGDLIKPRGRTL